MITGKTLREGIGEAHMTYVRGFEALLALEQKGRLGALRRAERLQPLFPAFRVFGLLPADK